jgi:ABC-type antimicrobial peptide transport system permease subunit
VAEDIRTSEDLSKDAKLYYYRPITQTQAAGGGLFVRVAGNSDRAVESVRRALQKEMPGSSYVTVQPFERVFGQTIKSWRLGATMFSVFGGLALILAAIGMYSVLAYNVAQRTHELGVRVAFGAQVRDVIQLVLGEGMRLTMAGIALGGAVALWWLL